MPSIHMFPAVRLHGPPRTYASATRRQCQGLHYLAAQLAYNGHDKKQLQRQKGTEEETYMLLCAHFTPETCVDVGFFSLQPLCPSHQLNLRVSNHFPHPKIPNLGF